MHFSFLSALEDYCNSYHSWMTALYFTDMPWSSEHANIERNFAAKLVWVETMDPLRFCCNQAMLGFTKSLRERINVIGWSSYTLLSLPYWMNEDLSY